MALQKIQFKTNVPIETALKFAEGKLCDSQFGDPQYMFTTVDDRVFFVHEKVASKIHGLRLRPQEPLEIVKAEVDYGNGRKGIEWQVSKVGFAPSEDPEASVPAPAPVSAHTQTPKVSNNGNSSKNGRSAPVGDPDAPMPWALFLLSQTRALIDVYAMALQYAGEKHGNAVKPEDVRGLLTTAFINQTKQGGGPNVA